jgi:AcrR family transcriptional regulator
MSGQGLRERKKVARRSLILSRGRELFERLGFDDASVEMIAEAADVSPGTVYNFFPSKIGILMEIQLQEITSQMDRRLAEAGPAPADARAGMLQLIEHQLRVLDALNRRELKLVTTHALLSGRASSVGQIYAEADAFLQGEIFERLEAYRQAGVLSRTVQTQPLAALIFSAVNGEFYVWLADDDPTIEAVLDRVRTHLARLLPDRGEAESDAR